MLETIVVGRAMVVGGITTVVGLTDTTGTDDGTIFEVIEDIIEDRTEAGAEEEMALLLTVGLAVVVGLTEITGMDVGMTTGIDVAFVEDATEDGAEEVPEAKNALLLPVGLTDPTDIEDKMIFEEDAEDGATEEAGEDATIEVA